MEKWKQYRTTSYSISNWGLVRNDRTGHVLHPSINWQGILYVKLNVKDKWYVRSLALMVAQVWQPSGNEVFNSVIHLDGNKMNCSADNLRMRPRSMVVEYHGQFTRKQPSPWKVDGAFIELTENVALAFTTVKEARTHFGVLDRHLVMNLSHNNLLALEDKEPLPIPITEHIFVYL